MRCQCQYCDTPRTHIGWWGSAPVSLCEKHRKAHGADFDRVTEVRMCAVPGCDQEKKEGINFRVCDEHYETVQGES